VAVNEFGHLLDDNGNPCVDFVWGNLPLQPNDARWAAENPLLGTMDDSSRALAEYSGYPSFTPNVGNTLNIEGPAFRWPALYLCYTDGFNFEELKLYNVINTLVACGVPREYFVDFTFSGGSGPYDTGGTPNNDGALFWYYIDPKELLWEDTNTGYKVFGKDVDHVVLYSNFSPNTVVAADSGDPTTYSMVVYQCQDPTKNTGNWW